MRVGLLGINHKLADLKLREQLAKACQRRFSPGSSSHGDHAFVLLSTCNRTEIYFSSDDLPNTHTYLMNILRQDVDDEFDQKLYSYFGADCFQHLARVTSGLDSAIIAETEIQGQVRTAYELASDYHSLPFEMHYMFQKCLKIGKKVRSEFPIKAGLPDLEHAVYTTGKHKFGCSGEPKVLFVGVSEINCKILHFLRNKNLCQITLCNRTNEKSKQLALENNLGFLEWDCLSSWVSFDWIIVGTKCADFLITKNDLPKGTIGEKLIMDLAVPRNVQPEIGRHKEITLLNIDQINRMLKIRKKKITDMLIKTEEIISKETIQQLLLFKEKEKERERLLTA